MIEETKFDSAFSDVKTEINKAVQFSLDGNLNGLTFQFDRVYDALTYFRHVLEDKCIENKEQKES